MQIYTDISFVYPYCFDVCCNLVFSVIMPQRYNFISEELKSFGLHFVQPLGFQPGKEKGCYGADTESDKKVWTKEDGKEDDPRPFR